MARLVAAAAAVALVLTVLPVAAAEQAKVITPEDGGRYPLLSLLRGVCVPEDPLHTPQGEDGEYAQRTSTTSAFYADNGDRIGIYHPTRDPDEKTGDGSTGSGPCEWSTRGGTVKLGGENALVAIHSGTNTMDVTKGTDSYYGCSAEANASAGCGESGIGWYDDPRSDAEAGVPEPAVKRRRFEIYDSCTYTVTELKGHVFTSETGSSKQVTVKAGDAVPGGRTLVLRKGAALKIVNGAGFEVTVAGPSETALEARKHCTQLFDGRLPLGHALPDDPPPPKVKSGWTRVKEFFGISPEVEAGRQTYEGIFSNVAPRMAARRGPVEFTVQRNQRKRTTTACAKYGRVRITHLASSVPKGRRVLVVPAGGCAVTVDGRASRLR